MNTYVIYVWYYCVWNVAKLALAAPFERHALQPTTVFLRDQSSTSAAAEPRINAVRCARGLQAALDT